MGAIHPSILAGGAELLDRIGPMWEQQRDFHAGVNATWRDFMRTRTWTGRREELVRSARSANDFCVHVARDDDAGVDVGYAISLVLPNGGGTIESLFVVADRRGQGLGEHLLHEAIAWLKSRRAERIALHVLIGNDAALQFYERRGFVPRTTEMELVENPTPAARG